MFAFSLVTYLNQRRRKQIENGWARIPAKFFFCAPLLFGRATPQFGGHCTHQGGHKDGQY